MLTVVLGLAGALVYGAADFVGGLAARRISALRVTALGAVSGVVLLLVGALVIPGRWSAEALLWGGISGVTGAAAIALLYACLAIGPMSILSPLTAVTSAIVPLTWGLATGSQLGPLAYPALGLALVAVVLVGFVPGEGAVRPSARGLVMATISGTLIGAFYILMEQTPDDSGLVPLIANRTVNATVMVAAIVVVAVVAAHRGVRADARLAVLDGAHGAPHALGTLRSSAAGLRAGWRGGIALALVCGVLDAAANVIALLGLRLGDLEVVSVLTALYPAGTILLAAVVLGERVARPQWVGLALALAASAMLALA